MAGAATLPTRLQNALAVLFRLCSPHQMTRIDEAEVSNAILAAPGWARVGITMPDARLRVEAAAELARAILHERSEGGTACDQNQLWLAL